MQGAFLRHHLIKYKHQQFEKIDPNNGCERLSSLQGIDAAALILKKVRLIS
jgi:hypothetical protein